MNADIMNYLGLAGCLALSFLLSGMEAGVFALNRLRVRRLARAGRPSARLLYRFLENPENFLWTILVGNTLANFLILGWVIVKLYEWIPEEPALIVGIYTVSVFLFYTLFDLLPKMLFRAHPNRYCLAMANVFQPIQLVLRPIVWLVEDVSAALLRWTGGRVFTGRPFGNREEMVALMQESAQVLTRGERAMINRVLDLEKYTVGQIAKPLGQTVTIEAPTPVRQVLALAHERGLSRLPVWEAREGQRRIAGLLTLDSLLFRAVLDLDKPASAHMAPALFVDEHLRLEIALRRMQRAGQRLAIVLARDRREVGVVSLEDILRVMFGEVKL